MPSQQLPKNIEAAQAAAAKMLANPLPQTTAALVCIVDDGNSVSALLHGDPTDITSALSHCLHTLYKSLKTTDQRTAFLTHVANIIAEGNEV
jgi:hypothetical protein